MKFTGKCSSFGGPLDDGVGPTDGLALIELGDLQNPYFGRLFLPFRNGRGLARSLNPQQLYCAMRWDQIFDLPMAEARALARLTMVRISKGELHTWVQPVDYGPGDGNVVDGRVTENTGRLIDLSPEALVQIGAQTDDVITVEVFE